MDSLIHRDASGNNAYTGTAAPLPVDLGGKTDAKDSHVDATSLSVTALLKQLSYSLQGLARAAVVDGAAPMTRPANQTPYSIGDAVSNDATAGSVTPITFTISDANDEPIVIRRIRITTPDTGPGTAVAQFRIWLYRSDPTASTGVVGGDNVAFSTKLGTFLGRFTGSFLAFSDGSACVLTPEDGTDMIVRPTAAGRTIYALLQTQTAFTPSANSLAYTLTLEGFQGRA